MSLRMPIMLIRMPLKPVTSIFIRGFNMRLESRLMRLQLFRRMNGLVVVKMRSLV